MQYDIDENLRNDAVKAVLRKPNEIALNESCFWKEKWLSLVKICRFWVVHVVVQHQKKVHTTEAFFGKD